ncbi:DHS-like NAD/FAD-binding domain-containing protein [Suillus ampliporus]|nr:DHS-like NAD/FAD-binding domain-containing protein [Suillus ampliporus]
MLKARTSLLSRVLARSYATAASPHALVFLEHRQGELDSASLSALTAASQLGGQVTGLVVGSPEEVPSVVEKAKRLNGLNTLLHSASPQYSTFSAKSILPRVAAKLDVPAVSDITSLEHDAASGSTTFTLRASSSIPIKFFTVRSTAFAAAGAEDAAESEIKALDPVEVSDAPSEHLSTSLTKSDRPDLGVATRVVSGGRALKNAETFQSTLYPLADALGAAVGASRAAVDAGYADNSLQVGQTGKVVAPELYMALGISGAIQHLAGMKDSKLIVAVNKDPDAPIFQVADVGLVADLFEVVPEMVEKLKQ